MKKYLIIILAICILVPKVIWASVALVNVESKNAINALEGVLIVPNGVNIQNIYDGNSTILFWVDKPAFDSSSHAVRFSGFTPGGFQGRRIVFSIEGDFKDNDLGKFTFNNVRGIRNDGQGTIEPVELSLATSSISKDNVPPEDFKPEISRSADVSNNEYFVSFATEDKGLGIDHYEFATSRFFSPDNTSWQKVTNPLVLKNSDLSKRIFIKAVDKSGNVRVSTLFGPKYYEYTFIGFIISVLILCALFYIIRMFL